MNLFALEILIFYCLEAELFIISDIVGILSFKTDFIALRHKLCNSSFDKLCAETLALMLLGYENGRNYQRILIENLLVKVAVCLKCLNG